MTEDRHREPLLKLPQHVSKVQDRISTVHQIYAVGVPGELLQLCCQILKDGAGLLDGADELVPGDRIEGVEAGHAMAEAGIRVTGAL